MSAPGEEHCPVYEIEEANASYAASALEEALNASCKTMTYGGHTYVLLEGRFDYETAQIVLAECGIEGYLACFETEEEFNAVSAIMNSVLEKDRDDCAGGFWIGLSRKSPAASEWNWVNGEAFSYTNWYEDQPDDSGNLVKIVPSWEYQWDDCFEERHCFVCEWDSLDSVPEELRQVSE